MVVLSFIAYTYKVYEAGYTIAISESSLEAFEAERIHKENIDRLEAEFSEKEREYLEQKVKDKKEFDYKYNSAMEKVNSYVKDNGYTDCNIGTDGVRRINDLLRGKASSN